MFTKNELTPVCLEIFEEVKKNIPAEIAERLKSHRRVINHTNKTDTYLFDIWDRSQIGLERDQFCYCLNYKPHRTNSDGTRWLLHLRCNIARIRRYYKGVRTAVRDELQHLEKVCPQFFRYQGDEETGTIELRSTFGFDGKLDKLKPLVVPRYIDLITATHPTLVRAIDIFHARVSDSSLEEDGIEMSYPRRKRANVHRLSDYVRPPSPSMKKLILEKFNNACARCGKPLVKGNINFHHVQRVTDGGLRRLENFEPLHIKCHREAHRELRG